MVKKKTLPRATTKSSAPKHWTKDWKSLAAAAAIVGSVFASIRGEMANTDADSAKSKAKIASASAQSAEDEALDSATAVLGILSMRLKESETTAADLAIFVAAMYERDKYWEKTLWDVYRRQQGTAAADKILAKAPEKASPPKLEGLRKPMPVNAAAAKAEYRQACANGDPLCTTPLSR